MSERKVLLVLSDQGDWYVKWKGGERGASFADKADAIAHARTRVGGLPEGECSQILVQRHDGTWQTEWTYGDDPFPPRG